MTATNRILQTKTAASGFALLVGAVCLTAAPARAGEFGRGFENELGRIAAHAVVGIGAHAVLHAPVYVETHYAPVVVERHVVHRRHHAAPHHPRARHHYKHHRKHHYKHHCKHHKKHHYKHHKKHARHAYDRHAAYDRHDRYDGYDRYARSPHREHEYRRRVPPHEGRRYDVGRRSGGRY